MEISEKRSNASRINGAKSRGPKTPEGKRNSSRNALRHGLLADTILIAGESRAHFIQFSKSLMAELRPQGMAEELLAEKVVVAQWRLKRLWAIESSGITREIRDLPADLAQENTPTQAWFAMRKIAEDRDRADTLNLYELRFDTIQHRAFESLMRHQRHRLAHDKRTQHPDENKAPLSEIEPGSNPPETQTDPEESQQ